MMTALAPSIMIDAMAGPSDTRRCSLAILAVSSGNLVEGSGEVERRHGV